MRGEGRERTAQAVLDWLVLGGSDTVLFYAGYKPGSHREGVDTWDLIRITSQTQRYRTWQVQVIPHHSSVATTSQQ